MTIGTWRKPQSVLHSVGLLLVLGSLSIGGEARCESYRSPFDVAFSSDGQWLAVSDRTASCVYILDPASSSVTKMISLQGRPTGIASIGDRRLLVAEYDAGTLAEVDVSSGQVVRRISVGPKPYGVAITPDASAVVVTDFGLGTAQVLDLAEGIVRGKASVGPQPGFLSVTPDGKTAIVGNQIIRGASSNLAASACISLIDLENCSVLAEVYLPDGSSNVRCVVTDRAGRWAYVAHTRGRVALPTTQLERGWVNVNALSIIDLQKQILYATLLLDRVTAGAADPWGVALTPDGTTAFVTLSGVHEVARLDLTRLHKYLAGQPDRKLEYDVYSGSADHVWGRVRNEPERRVELLSHHLSALYGAGLMTRHRLPVEGPRGVDVSPDGTLVAVAGYFSGSVLLFAPDSPESNRILQLGPVPQINSVRRGEMLFHDGRACFQGWLTCASCHAEGRVDGLNWDLQNDGVGNPKNARSMVHAATTPPSMSLGVRANYKEATTAGFRFILFHEPTQNEAEDVQSYIASLTPERSPYLVKGAEGERCLSAAAQRGKELFESPTVGCARCHSGTLSTDLRSHDVGTHDPRDRNGKYDTPALSELWRTAPYLHDGRAASLLDVLTVHNADDKHGITSHLTSDQLDDLAHYLLSL